jgi:hypothetical protein
MDKQTRQIEFSKLRFAYFTIKSFLENESFAEVKSLNSKIAGDLGMTGDDTYELLVKFIEKFDLDYKGFEFDNHFFSEGELYGSGAALINLLTLSIWLPLKTIELLTFNKIKLNKPDFYQPDRQVDDMTFRDFLTWYIEGNYVPSKELKYEIKNGTQQRV